MTLEVGDRKVSHCPWRLGSGTLSQPEDRQAINDSLFLYLEANKPEDTSTFNFWCSLKAVVRGSAFQVAAWLKRLYKRLFEQAEAEAASLEAAHKADSSNKKLYVSLLSAREKVNSFCFQEVRSNLESLNQKCYVFGNRASRLLAHKLRGRRAKERVPHIYTAQGAKILSATV